MFEYQSRLAVQWGDCDPAGIVFFPNYLVWCDNLTSALFAGAGLPLHALFAAHGVIGVPIVDVRRLSKFRLPSEMNCWRKQQSPSGAAAALWSATFSISKIRWRLNVTSLACGPVPIPPRKAR